jgi:hypothetical protein
MRRRLSFSRHPPRRLALDHVRAMRAATQKLTANPIDVP